MSNLTTGVYNAPSVGNSSHCILECGSNYSAYQTTAQAYDSSLVKTSLSASTANRCGRGASKIGNYLVFLSCRTQGGNSEFYDNSNVRTTTTNPYGKVSDQVLGVNTDQYAMFFGGNTNNGFNATYSFSDIKVLDSNLVVSSSNMPVVGAGMQGFAYKTSYALVCNNYGLAYIYDNNLQVASSFYLPTAYAMSSYAAATSNFGLVLQDGKPPTSLIVF